MTLQRSQNLETSKQSSTQNSKLKIKTAKSAKDAVKNSSQIYEQ